MKGAREQMNRGVTGAVIRYLHVTLIGRSIAIEHVLSVDITEACSVLSLLFLLFLPVNFMSTFNYILLLLEIQGVCI